MEWQNNEIENTLSLEAFRRTIKGMKKHDAAQYLGHDDEYAVMLVCVNVAGNPSEGREWYNELEYHEVYKWFAVKLAEIPDG